MEERIYYAQNWRHDVSALITDDGRMIEWVKYSSYGVPMSLPAGDTDSDGDFDGTDAAAITGTYDVRKDVNLDGTVDVLDYLDALDLNGGLSTQGWSILSNPKWNNRKGYAGYEGDTVLAGTKWHVRHRVLDSELGRWMRRDPLGYVDGASVWQYVTSNAVMLSDPTGLAPPALGLCASNDPNKANFDDRCTQNRWCGSDKRRAGATNCDPNDNHGMLCCVCDTHIDVFSPPGSPGDDAIRSCVTAHEEAHLEDGCPHLSDPRKKACIEADRNRGEIGCLLTQLDDCLLDALCWQNIQNRISKLHQIVDQYMRLCYTLPGPGNGGMRPAGAR